MSGLSILQRARLWWDANWPLALSWLSLSWYLPLLGRFFWSDDWYHLALSRVEHLSQVLLFFSPLPNEFSTPMYRPLGTQFLFFLMRSIFGFWAPAWYAVAIILLGLLFFVVWKWLKELPLPPAAQNVSLLIFAFSASHFARVSYLSALQEVLMAIFVVATLYFSSKKSSLWKIVLFTFLAFLSKETAVVIAPLLVVQSFWLKRWRMKEIILIGLLTVAYLAFRFGVYGIDRVGEEHYAWNFSPFRALHTAGWYAAWSLGLPETLLNYVGGGLQILPRFWTDFLQWGKPIVGGFLLVVGSGGLAFVAGLRKKNFKNFALSLVVFFLGLSPVLFLPDHKFPLDQTLGLLGLSLACGVLVSRLRRVLQIGFVGIFLFYNATMLLFAHQTHYSVVRSEISYRVYQDFASQQENWSNETGVFFLNDPSMTHPIWGSSKQIDQAIFGQHFMKAAFDRQTPLRFEDEIKREELPEDIEWIERESRLFLQ